MVFDLSKDLDSLAEGSEMTNLEMLLFWCDLVYLTSRYIYINIYNNDNNIIYILYIYIQGQGQERPELPGGARAGHCDSGDTPRLSAQRHDCSDQLGEQ